MISCENLGFFFTLMTLSLSSSPTCPLATSFLGRWRQPGLADLITINETWFSSKGICLHGQEDIANKLIYSNEQTRCKRCVLFIPRHFNVLQYRESECFDTDDVDDEDHSRICGSITPDSVLYTLFREDAKSIPCPFNQTWAFRRSAHSCQPKSFHQCLAQDTFQIVYNQHCSIDQDEMAQCFAQFSDGSMNYILSRSLKREKLICFSYSKNTSPNEIYFSKDATCGNLLTKESTIKLHRLPNKDLAKQLSIPIPPWMEGTWFSINNETFTVNQTHIRLNMNGQEKSLQIIQSRQEKHQRSVFLRTQLFQQCSAKFHCMHLIYRSPSVIDFAFDKHGCRHSSTHYTLFKPTSQTDVSCPEAGVYRSLKTYRSTLSSTACSMSLWRLAIGCQKPNQSDLVLSSSCHHPIIPEVQVITSIEGRCLATWRTDQRFQRTLVQYEQSKAFCLIQPIKAQTASWILSETSCTHLNHSSIQIENSFQYLHTCQSSSATFSHRSFFLLLFYLTIQINM